ncbi:hypothetical protein T07_3379 [Trichinella nelsoni]|uniref:PiggyBac transposable element-derived protein domain-containing protein n=1 Tax=Trichinella nelsoni TaxID=6336 RepID=A0A0V0SK80_9BILA|nr:hypothetical protein T07_3379 [Trichinella nelsoni]
MTNSEGKRLYKDAGKEIEETEFHAYIGLLILAGVYKSHGEATKSLWNTENGRPVFPSVMPVNNFKRISRIMQFDDREKRSHRRKDDPLAAIRDIYTGKRASGIRGKNQGMRVVLDLTAGLKGNNSICDHFFTSHEFELAMKLLKKKLTIPGTIKNYCKMYWD